MKTIKDAANEFKGEYPSHDNLLKGDEVLILVGDCGSLEVGATGYCDYLYKHLCNESEFNQCVDEMATNYGTSETYSNYKANYTAINDDMKPVAVPTFTPPVKCKQGDNMYLMGALYEFKDECDSSWELGRLVDINGGLFRCDTGQKREWYAEIREVSIEIGTITEAPIELIESQLYLFDIGNNKKLVGEAYLSDFAEDWMINSLRTNSNYKASKCTNIKLLEVKS